MRNLESLDGAHRQALSVARLVAGSPAADVLREGDLLLAIDGRPLNRVRDVERATRAPQVNVTVLRDGAERSFDVQTAALDGGDIDRLLLWAGAVLHAPHRAMSAQRGIPPEGVFVAYFSYGSPATRYKLFAGRRIVEVDGVATPDLDAFVAAVRGRADRSSLRSEDDHLERIDRNHHAQARSALLADLRVAAHARRLAAPGDRLIAATLVAPRRQQWLEEIMRDSVRP